MHFSNPQTQTVPTVANTPSESFSFGRNPSWFARKRQFDRPDMANPVEGNLVDRSPTLPPVRPLDLSAGGVDARS